MAQSESEHLVEEEKFTKLRKQLLSETVLKPQRFLTKIEQASDRIYTVDLPDQSGKKLGTLRFKRLTHGDIIQMNALPFYHKFLSHEKLTDDENERLKMMELEMIRAVTLDKARWDEIVQENDQLIEPVFNVVLAISGIDEQFNQELDDFMNTEFGYNYGFIWFGIFGKLPSEVAKLPESDVKTVTSWVVKWSERMRENK